MTGTKKECAQTSEYFYLCPCCKRMLKISGNGAVTNVELDTAPTVIDPVSGAAYSLVVDCVESAFSPKHPDYSPVELLRHEREWPRFGRPQPNARDSEFEKKNHQFDQCTKVSNTDQ